MLALWRCSCCCGIHCSPSSTENAICCCCCCYCCCCCCRIFTSYILRILLHLYVCSLADLCAKLLQHRRSEPRVAASASAASATAATATATTVSATLMRNSSNGNINDSSSNSSNSNSSSSIVIIVVVASLDSALSTKGRSRSLWSAFSLCFNLYFILFYCVMFSSHLFCSFGLEGAEQIVQMHIVSIILGGNF